MKGYVYFLKSDRNKRYYVGCSEDPRRRLEEFHNAGKVKATKYMRPWRLIFLKECLNMTEARKLECKIKRQKSQKYLENIMKSANG